MTVQNLPTNDAPDPGGGLLDALQQWRDSAWTATSECHVPEHRAIDANRATIELAKGLLMRRYGMDDVRAFSLLVRRARKTHTPVHTLARTLVHGIDEAAPWLENPRPPLICWARGVPPPLRTLGVAPLPPPPDQ